MKSVAILLGVVLLASPASAQWAATAYLGDATTLSSRFDLRSTTGDAALVVEPISFDDESFQSPWYYGARITRRFGRAPWFGLEAEFIHAKAIADPSQIVSVRGHLEGSELGGQQRLGAILPRFELSHGLNFVLGNAMVQWPIGPRGTDAWVTVVGRLGAGATIPHVESTFQGQEENHYQLGGMAFAGAIGGEVRLSHHFSALVELKLTRTRQRVQVGSADIEGAFTTCHVVAGVTWRIRSARHRPFTHR